MSPDQLMGRSLEVAALSSAINSPRGSVTLLVGEPGIGKSALLAVARVAAQNAGYTVLEAVGAEGEVHLPFGAMQQLLAPLIEDIDTLPPAQRSAIETAFGLAEGSSPDLFLIAEAAFSLLARKRSGGLLVIVIDDLQWIDPQSHQILTFLAHRANASGFCVLGAVRADHPGPFADAGFPELVVRGVDDDAAEALLDECTAQLTAGARSRIRREAEGNPLALLELPRAWVDEPPADDRPVPLSIRLEEAFAGRVSELPEATRDALLVAAIESSSEADEITAALTNLSVAHPPADVFGPAVSAGLVREVSTTVEFRHPLVRAGVLRREPLIRQHAAHHALAEVLTVDTYRRTWHRAWSIIGPDDAIADELAGTVPDSLRRGAAMTAVSSLERSAQLASTPTRRGERLLEAAQCAFSAGRPDVVARILEEVSFVDLSELDQARVTWLREALNGDVASSPETIRELCVAANKANELGDVGLALNLLISAGLRCWWAESADDGRTKVLSVLDGLTEARDDPRHITAIALTAPVLRGSEVASTLRAVNLEEADDGDVLRTYGMAAYAVGNLPLATDLLDRAEQLFREQGRLGMLPVVLALQLRIRLELGDWAGAAAAGDEVNSVSIETGQPIFADNNVFIEGSFMALHGEWRPALEHIADAEDEATRQRINDRVCLAYQARGTALLSGNRTAEAFDCLKRQFDPQDVGYHLRESFCSISLLVEAALDSGHLAEARQIVAALEATSMLSPSPLLEVNLLYARAALAPQRERGELYEVALQHDLTRWPWVHARIKLEYGRWLVDVNRSAEGTVQLIAARAVFEQIGAPRWTGRANEALELNGVETDLQHWSSGTRAQNLSLIGRDAERAELRQRISAIEREGCTVIVRGAAGVGKSSLLSATVDIAKEFDVLVLESSGIESESMEPFAGLRQLLQPILADCASLPEIQHRALLTALGLQDGPAPQLFLVALATLTLITDAAATKPVLLVVDDVQWLDASTNDVLAFIARRVQFDPVMVLVGLREGHVVALTTSDAREINLVGLDEASSRALLDMTDHGLTSDARAVILSHARGNPLALVELPPAWRSAGTEALQTMSTTVPLTTRLERAFASRIVDLPASTRDALLVSAVDRDDNLDEVLTATALLSGSVVTIDVLEPAQEAGLITFNGAAIRFRHPLVRSGILQNEPLSRQQAAHRAMSVALRSQPFRSVWHLAHSVDGPDDAIADQLFASHKEGIARGSVETAVSILERSAELTSDSQTRGRRLLLAAQLAFVLGRVDLVNRLVDAAGSNALSELDFARAEWLREIFTEGELGDSARIVELTEFASRCASSGDNDLALDLLSSAALRSWWAIPDFDVRERVIQCVEGLTESQADPRWISAIAVTEPLRKGRETSARLAAIAPVSVSDANQLLQLGMAARAIGAEVAAADYFDRAEAKVREQGQLGLLPHVLAINAAVSIDLGDWRRAGRSLDEARRVAIETGQPTWKTGVLAVEAVYLALRGDTDAALKQAANLYHLFSDRGANDFLCLAQFARGAAYLSSGQPATAYTELKPVFERSDPRHHPRESLSALMLFVEAAVGCNEHEAARVVVERMEALAREIESPILNTQLLYARPVLADDDDAEGLFRDGLAHDLTRWPWPRARIQLAYGNWLRRQHRAAEAREPLHSSLATFELIGACSWATEARAALRAAGDRNGGTTPGSSESLLNAQEMQIAQLAAEGLSNREIGQQVYLSPRTVGSYLYRIYPKLGITSRTQLTARLTR